MKLLALLVVSSLADVVIALPKASSNSSCSANYSSASFCSNPSSSASSSVSSSSSASSPSNSSSQDSINDACAKISKAVAEANRTNATSLPPIPAEEGLGCLKSMPFDKSLGGQFLTQLRKYIAFQTTLEPLKNPPSTYVGSPVDVLGGLDKIAAKLGTYTSQFDFDSDIKNLVKTANDGHFSVKLCSTEVYRFSRPVSIVSVSKDGLELPELYTGSDAALLGGGGNGKAVSPIVSINGQDPQVFLAAEAKYRSLQDPDARYNSLFPNKAVSAAGSGLSGGFFTSVASVREGSDVTSLQFKNGSTKEFATLTTKVPKDFTATSGRELFVSACLPKPAPPPQKNSRSPPHQSVGTKIRAGLEAGPKGFPKPLIRDPFNHISGYYLDNDMETAVLFISSFEGTDRAENDSKVFADVATKFVNNAARDGRTKLVIDVTRNPGGEISRGFDLFKLFFPNQFPYSATRFRRHTGADSLVEIFGALNKSSGNPFAFKANVKPDQTSDFKSLQDFLGVDQPAELGAPVSALYANFNYTNSALSGRPLRGFGNDTKLPKQGPFKAENIVIIGDGACSSTCTTFINLMVNVGGVRTLAFGGRPKLAPMQVMGGVRGAQAAEFKFIDTIVSVANKFMARAPKGTFSEQLIKTANASLPPGLSKMPLVLPGGGVNLRNAYQKGNDYLPEQFSYQAADCRLFYTAENVVMPNTTWKAASDAIWGSKGCVKGSTGGPGSRGNKATGSQQADQGVIRSAGSTLPVAWSLIVACLSAALVW